MTTLATQRSALSEPTPHSWASGGLLSAAFHIGIVLVIANLLWSQVGDKDAAPTALVVEIVSAAQAANTQAARPTVASPAEPNPAEPSADIAEPQPPAPITPPPTEPAKDTPLPQTTEPVPQQLAQPVPPQPATLVPPPPQPPVKPVAKPPAKPVAAKPVVAKPPAQPVPNKPAPLAATPATEPTDATRPDGKATAQTASLPPGDGDIPVVSNPRFRVPPRPAAYPRRSVELSEEGTVMIRALVDGSGLARDVRIWRTSGHPRLDEAARTAVAQWQFEPARHAGRPITAWVEIPVNFRIQ